MKVRSLLDLQTDNETKISYKAETLPDGLVIMECEEPVTRRPTGQIVMDYLTDTVVNHKVTLLGEPYITPDSRTVVTVHRERSSITLYVQRTSGNFFVTGSFHHGKRAYS